MSAERASKRRRAGSGDAEEVDRAMDATDAMRHGSKHSTTSPSTCSTHAQGASASPSAGASSKRRSSATDSSYAGTRSIWEGYSTCDLNF